MTRSRPGRRTAADVEVGDFADHRGLTKKAIEVLTGLALRLQPGTAMLFDEYFNYPGWERHEYEAWQEFVKAQHVQYEYAAYARQQVMVRIKGIGST
jgi:hypothetical protein